ncbi:MAG TPA: sugar transferase [Ktedonobacteraceae bacterium]|nr:sugar transferase [Ktedonobacteraceae bacterium]
MMGWEKKHSDLQVPLKHGAPTTQIQDRQRTQIEWGNDTLDQPENGRFKQPPHEGRTSFGYRCWSSCLDFTFVLLGLLILLLLLPLLAIVIRLDSPGPIFYWQPRKGYRGQIFSIYKFRTMFADSGPEGQEVWASINDTRITRVGRFLRVTHLDELPQVINIVRGEMSLIGPRPEQPMLVSHLEQCIPRYSCRMHVKPGLTGWAQVNYHYGGSDLDTRQKLHYDLYYIEHRSIKLDITIVLKTIIEMVRCRGR